MSLAGTSWSRALSIVARHELRRLAHSRALRVAAALVAALFIVAFLLEAARYRREAHERRALQALVYQQWLDQPDRHPHRASHYGSFAFRPPNQLSWFDPGVEAFAGTAVFLEPHRRNSVNFSEAVEDGGLARFGTPSPAFVLSVLIPLLIFFLAFPSVAGEREAGTFRLLVSQGISARTIIAGKIAGVTLAITILLFPLFALALLGALFAGALAPSFDTLTRVALLALAYGFYLTSVAALAVLVSSFHRRAHGALLTLLALWVALWIVAPRALAGVARRVSPAPARAALELSLLRALRGAGDSHDPTDPHFNELRQRTLAQHGAARVEDLPFNYGGFLMQEAEAITSAVYNDHYKRAFEAHLAEERLVHRFGLISPLISLRAFSMGIAGTDIHHFIDFQEQAEAHRFQMTQDLNTIHKNEIHWQNDRAQRVDRRRWKDFRPFSYAPPDVRASLSRAAAPGLSLLAFGALLALAVTLVPRRRGELT